MTHIFQGQLFVNGVNLGRYWPHKGPQVRLYVPKYALKEGNNAVTLLELEKSVTSQSYVTFYDKPLINGTVSPSSDHWKSHTRVDRMDYKGNLSLPDSEKKNSSPEKTQLTFLKQLFRIVMKVVESKWGILLL